MKKTIKEQIAILLNEGNTSNEILIKCAELGFKKSSIQWYICKLKKQGNNEAIVTTAEERVSSNIGYIELTRLCKEKGINYVGKSKSELLTILNK